VRLLWLKMYAPVPDEPSVVRGAWSNSQHDRTSPVTVLDGAYGEIERPTPVRRSWAVRSAPRRVAPWTPVAGETVDSKTGTTGEPRSRNVRV
jgi:hypothetical protein